MLCSIASCTLAHSQRVDSMQRGSSVQKTTACCGLLHTVWPAAPVAIRLPTRCYWLRTTHSGWRSGGSG